MTILNITCKIIFYIALVFIGVAIFGLTSGQSLDYEFANSDTSRRFYDIIMPGLPIAILLTLFGTIKAKHDKSGNIGIAVFTIIACVISFFIMVSMLFSVGFIVIENDSVLFREKDNPKIIIAKQTIGQGALGSDGHRIVKLEPFLILWNKVSFVDTATINKNEWNFVNERKAVNDNWKIEDGKLIYY